MASTLAADLIDRTQRLTDRVDPKFRVRTLNALDEAVQWYAMAAPWDGLKRTEDFVTNGTEFLVLPDRIARILTIGDKTNSRHIQANDQFLPRNPASYLGKTAGALGEWRPMGMVPVTKQPTTRDTLDLSTTVSEAMEVTIRGLVQDTTASGTSMELYEVQETVTMDGTTKTTTNTFDRIEVIQKQKDTLADLKVQYTTSSDLVSRIPTWETRPLFQQIQFMFVPTAGTNLEIEYLRRPDRLTSESDAIDATLNEEALMWRAAGNMHWKDNEGQQAQIAWAKAQEIITNAKRVEESFGERGNQIQPWTGYHDMEHLNGLDFD